MAFSAYEGNVLNVQGMNPITIFMGEANGIREILSDVHVDTDHGIEVVFVHFCLFHRLNTISQGFTNLLLGGFFLVFLRE